MTFDLKGILNEEKVRPTTLSAALCGPSGGGKSYAIGTLGVRTLHLYGIGEEHAADSSMDRGGENIVPVCWDGKDRTPDQAYELILKMLEPKVIQALKVEAVCIDGLTELERLVTSTEQFDTRVGKNKYQRIDEAIAMIGAVVSKALRLRKELGIHVVLTCIVDVKEKDIDGYIRDCVPLVTGYRVATTIVQMFADKLLVGGTSDGRRLQFGSAIQKDKNNEARKCVQFTNWQPGLGGVSTNKLAEILDDSRSCEPDLKMLADFKREAMTKHTAEP